MDKTWLLMLLCLPLACDMGGRYYPPNSPSSGGGSGSVYRTHSSCWGTECTIDIQEVGGARMRQRQAAAALACSLNSDCRQGMLCIDGACSPQCNADRDCEEGQLCIPAEHGYGECETAAPRVKLTEAIALEAMAPAIEGAQACFSDEDRANKAEVRVHLTIDGFGGRLEAVNLPGSLEGKPLGECIVKHMSTARFPPLTQPRVAYWYPVQAGVVPKIAAKPAAEASSAEDKLDASQIKATLDPLRAATDPCFERAAAGPDAQVAMRVTVEGSTGYVAAVEVLDEANGTPLGTCVTAAIAGATFPTFPAAQQRFTYKARPSPP